MIDVRRLEQNDLIHLLKYDLNEEERGWMTLDVMNHVCKTGHSIFWKDTLLMSGGILPYWRGRGQIWTLFSPQAKYHFVPLIRAIKKYLTNSPYNRIEANCNVGCEMSKRRFKLLGFSLDCLYANKYLPNGKEQSLYSWIRKD